MDITGGVAVWEDTLPRAEGANDPVAPFSWAASPCGPCPKLEEGVHMHHHEPGLQPRSVMQVKSPEGIQFYWAGINLTAAVLFVHPITF